MFLTSFNNMLAFFMAAFIRIPALRHFAIQVNQFKMLRSSKKITITIAKTNMTMHMYSRARSAGSFQEKRLAQLYREEKCDVTLPW